MSTGSVTRRPSDLPAEWVAGLRSGDPKAVEAGDRLLMGIALVTAREVAPRQLEALRLASEGATYDEIAATLYVSRETVKTTLRAARQNLGARSTTQAAVTAVRQGLI